MTEQERIKSIMKNGGMHLQTFKRENITYDMCVAAVTQSGWAIAFVPKEYLSAEIYALSCRTCGDTLRLVPPEQITKEMCMDAVQADAEALKYVPEQFCSEELYFAAALRNPKAFRYTPIELLRPEFCSKVIEKHGNNAIDDLPAALRNTSFYIQLVALRPQVLWCIPKKNRTKAVCKQALDAGWNGSLQQAVKEKPEFLSLVPPNMYDHEACLEFVQSAYFHDSLTVAYYRSCMSFENGDLVLHGGYHFNMSKLFQWHDVCMIAVKYHFGFLHYTPEKVITQELCWEAVRGDAESFRSVPPAFRPKELCMYAFERNKWAIENIPEEFITEPMCHEAVERSGSLLEYVPDKFKTKDLCKKAITNNGLGNTHSFIPDRIMDEELVLMCIKHDHTLLSQIPDHLRTSDVCQVAVEEDRRNLQYVPDEIITYDIVKTAVKRYGWVPGIPEKHITEELMLIAVDWNTTEFAKIPEKYLTEKVCMDALLRPSSYYFPNCVYLKNIPARFICQDFCTKYIQNKPDAILQVPEQYRTKELLMFTAERYPYIAERAIPDSLRDDKEFMEKFAEVKKK